MRAEPRPYGPQDFVPFSAEKLMPLETPLLKVSRPVAACSRCRSAKIKCDGKLPACTACERANRAKECSSTNDQFAKGKERSYVATLEARVEKLEKKVAEAKARRKSSLTMIDVSGFVTPRRVSVDASNKPRDRRAARRKELCDIDELVSDFGFLAVNATARDYYGFTSAMSYARLVLAASAKEPLPSGMKKDLPPRHAAMSLVQLYLQNIQVLLPILEETSFYPSLNNVYDSDSLKASPYDHWAVRMVLAIASAGQSQQRGDTYYADAVGHICAAIEHAEVVLHPGSIWSIQAMLLLVLYAMLDPNHFDSWTLIGAASRAMVDLGLHQDPSKSAQTSRVKLELRRRVYACVYVLDRSTSLVQTRTFSFSDDSARVGLPFQSKLTSPPSSPDTNQSFWFQSYEPALELIKLRQLQSSWYQQLFQSGRSPWLDPYSYIWVEYKKMADWFEKLPASIMPSTRDFFELELLYSYVYLLSPSPRSPEISEHAQKLIFEHCVNYSSKLLHLTTEASTKRTLFTFYDAIRVYMTAKHFVTILGGNLDRLLRLSTATPSSHYSNAMEADLDPLAPLSAVVAPPLPTPDYDSTSPDANNPVLRAMSTINDFTSVLSYFGQRFGYVGGISWRDRFQRESQQLLTQLQQRLQQQQQLEHGLSLWNGHQTTRQPSMGQPSPGPTTAYYPSPPNSHYSPEHIPARATSIAWPPIPGPSDVGELQVPRQPSMGADFAPEQRLTPMSVGDLGLSQLTAWQTLPGGSMNARFA